MHLYQLLKADYAWQISLSKYFRAITALKKFFLRQHWINYFSVTVDKLFNRDQGGNCAYVNDA